MTIIEYDRERAVEYAREWAYGRNPLFYDFSEIGGDCTNYASQCIFAGSGQMNFTPTFGWYYLSASNRTASWTGVQYLYNFLIGNDGLGPFGIEVGLSGIKVGDIIQLGNADGFYHTPFVVGFDNGMPLVAAHTLDALDRPLNTYIYERVRFVHVQGVRIP